MAKAYRFDDQRPRPGTTVHVFRTLNSLKNFAIMQGGKGTMKFWEIEGTILSDDGTMDGIEIKVSTVREVS